MCARVQVWPCSAGVSVRTAQWAGLLTLRAGVRVGGQLDVVAGEEPLPPVELALPPVAVVLVEHRDHLALLEGQLVVVLSHVVVHADHLAHSCRPTRAT